MSDVSKILLVLGIVAACVVFIYAMSREETRAKLAAILVRILDALASLFIKRLEGDTIRGTVAGVVVERDPCGPNVRNGSTDRRGGGALIIKQDNGRLYEMPVADPYRYTPGQHLVIPDGRKQGREQAQEHR